MSIFSRLFSKAETSLWPQFKGLSNDKGTLREKARVLAPVLIQISYEHSQSLKERILTSVDQGLVFFECLAIYLHLMDRVAFQALGSEKRNWFVDPLLLAILTHLGTVNDDDQQVAEMRDAFPNLYHQRINVYASCEFFAAPNEHGGYNIRQTVGWKLAESLGVGDVETKMSLMFDVSNFCTNFMEKLEIHRLISGTA
jgi:hypothetical protein